MSDSAIRKNSRKTLVVVLSTVIAAQAIATQHPPVIYRVSASSSELMWINNTPVQPPAEFALVGDAFEWKGRLEVRQAPGTGILSGHTMTTAKAEFGRANFNHSLFLHYNHLGGWPFFVSTLRSAVVAEPFVLGPPGTPFDATVDFFSGPGGFNYTAIGWTSPGWLFYQRYGNNQYRIAGTSRSDVVTFDGAQYSKLPFGITSNAETGYGNTGPGQPPFVVSLGGLQSMSVLVDNLSQQPDLEVEITRIENLIPGIEGAPKGHIDSRSEFRKVMNFWANNLKGRVVMNISNRGGLRTPPSNVRLAGLLASGHWVELGEHAIGEVLPGETKQVYAELAPLGERSDWSSGGGLTLVAEVDPHRQIGEISEFNNTDSIDLIVVDPRPPVVCYSEVANRAEGEALLASLGFEKYYMKAVHVGWGKALQGNPIRSVFDGYLKPASAFRVEGKVVNWGGRYFVCLQGNSEFGEPNPTMWHAWSNVFYVKDWHVGNSRGDGF